MQLKTSPAGPVIAHLDVADRLWSRTVGLLGREALAPDQGLWIKPCNSVHTFFMKFAIDLVFVDRDLVVRKVYHDVKPFRLTAPVWRAHGVIELPSGFLKRNPLQPGDKLHVDHPLP